MEIDQLRTFLTVLQHGNFSAAGEALRIGQSTVSFHIRELESAVGAKLLDRRGGRVRPTATGITLRRYARRIVSLREEALARVRAVDSGQAGQLIIAASTIPAEYLLPSALAEFLQAHPGVAVTVDVSDSRRATASLIAQECDLALVGAQVRDKRLVFTPFAEDEVVLVGRAESSGGPRMRRLTEEHLRQSRLIVREEGSGTRQAVASILAQHASLHEPDLPVVQLGSTEAVRRCVREGIGLAFISRRAIEEDLRTCRLVAYQARGLPVRRRFYVARLRTATLSTAARAFAAMLVQKNR